MTAPLSPPLSDEARPSGEPPVAVRGDAARAGATQLAAQAVRVVVSVATGMWLARLLTPTDFGVFAMVATLTGLVDTVRGFGLGPALVHTADWNAALAVRVSKLCLIGSAVLAALVLLAAVPLSHFYNEPRVVAVTLVVSVGVFFAGIPAVWEARLVRLLRFGPIARAETLALLLSVAAALTLALQEFGYWALVAQYVVFLTTRAALLRLGSGWSEYLSQHRQAAPANADAASKLESLHSLVAYGRHYTLAQFITFAGRGVDRIVVGVSAGPAVLGLYENAHRWSTFAVGQVIDPLYHVMLATLNRARRHGTALGAAVARVFLPPMSVVLPALAYLALETDVVVRVLLGDQWDAAVPFLRVLCGAAAATSVLKLTRVVHLVTGSTSRQLRFAIARSGILLGAAVLGMRWGAMGVAWGILIASWLLAVVSLWYSTIDTPIAVRDIVGGMARPFVAASIAALTLRMIAPALDSAAGVLAMLLRAAMFASLYLACWVVLPGGRAALQQLVNLARDVRASSAPAG